MRRERQTHSLRLSSSNVLAGIMIILIVLIFPSNNSQGWKRIEGDKIRIEKGDNLWRISHSLLGSGWRYMEIWQGKKDGYKTNDPNLIFPGMVFSYNSADTIDMVERFHSISPKIDKIIFTAVDIDSNLASLRQHIVKRDAKTFWKWVFQNLVLTIFVSATGGILCDIVLNWWWPKRRRNSATVE